ncbi:MAG: hypothetical protein MRZ79_04075 [Bacteroidia bacterium]|nr:hypothetical protein [Bacteroidia bacterium]
MNYPLNLIKELLDMAFEKAELPKDIKAGKALTYEINKKSGTLELGDRYIYRTLNNIKEIENEGKKQIGCRETYIDLICQYLGYKNFREFSANQGKIEDEILENCIGTWYSISRANSIKPLMLLAPVKIFKEGKNYKILMQGGVNKFEGLVERVKEVIYCSLSSESEKRFNFIMRIGYARNPKLLKGVFNGISSGGDPIAGRELLMRFQKDFQEMKPMELSLEGHDDWPDWLDRRLFDYFQDFNKNCLKASRSARFNLDDL